MKKILSILLVLVLAISACVMTTSADVAPVAVEHKVAAFSYQLKAAFDLSIYVKSNVGTQDTLKLLIFNEEPTNPNIADADDIVESPVWDSAKSRWDFSWQGIAARQLGDWFFFVAYANVDGEEYYSAPSKYSFARYARAKYDAAAKDEATEDDEEIADVAYKALEYGAAAQVAFDYKPELLCNETMCKVTVEGGTITQLNKTTAYFLAGEEFTITAPETNEAGAPFAGWVGGGYSFEDATATISVEEDITLVAQYGAGLTVESDDMGGYVVTGYDGAKYERMVLDTYAGAPITAIAAGAIDAEDAASVTIVGSDVIIEDGAIAQAVTINGYAGSTAETYAGINGNEFNQIVDNLRVTLASGGNDALNDIFGLKNYNYAGHWDNFADYDATNEDGSLKPANINWYLGYAAWTAADGTYRSFVGTTNTSGTDMGGFYFQLKFQNASWQSQPCDFSQFGNLELDILANQVEKLTNIEVTTTDVEGGEINQGNVVTTNYEYGTISNGVKKTISIPLEEAMGSNYTKASWLQVKFGSQKIAAHWILDAEGFPTNNEDASDAWMDANAPFHIKYARLTSAYLIEK